MRVAVAKLETIHPEAVVVQGMVAAWESACGMLDQYGMQYTRTFANLCNAEVQPAALAEASREACTVQDKLVGPELQQVASF